MAAVGSHAQGALDRTRQARGLHRLKLGRGRELGQHLPRREFSVANAGVKVVGQRAAVVARHARVILLGNLLQGHIVLARFLLQQPLANVQGLLALRDVDPVLDFVARPRGIHQAQPVAAGSVIAPG